MLLAIVGILHIKRNSSILPPASILRDSVLLSGLASAIAVPSGKRRELVSLRLAG